MTFQEFYGCAEPGRGPRSTHKNLSAALTFLGLPAHVPELIAEALDPATPRGCCHSGVPPGAVQRESREAVGSAVARATAVTM